MSDTLLAALVGGGFALLGVLIGARGERRRWLRDARRAAYIDYAEAVHALQSSASENRHDPIRQMHRALTQIGLVGPARVDKACQEISKCLRADPLDRVLLTHLYNDFITRAAVALNPFSWYSVLVRLSSAPSDEEILARVPNLRPPAQAD